MRKECYGQRKPVYWWISEIPDKKSSCDKVRRQYQRSKGTVECERLREIKISGKKH